MDPAEYCREIEAHLTRRNDGHLVRIVGPAFELVQEWARRGVPLKVAFEGIDRCVHRKQAKGPRRRPLRIEYCEADVLDAFDEWRRAVGLVRQDGPAAGGEADAAAGPAAAGRSRIGLATHIDRVMTRLTDVRVRGATPPVLRSLVDAVLRELDAERAGARGARGPARRRFIDRLAAIDASLGDGAVQACDTAALDELRAEADRELEPFGGRLAPEVRADSHARLVRRLARARFDLPVVSFE